MKFESFDAYEEFAIKILSSQYQGKLTVGLASKNIDLQCEVNLHFDKFDCITYQFPRFGEIYGTIYGGENHDMSEIFYFCKDDVLRKEIILL